MRRILSNWKSARRRNNNAKANTKGKGKQKKKHNLTNGTGKRLLLHRMNIKQQYMNNPILLFYVQDLDRSPLIVTMMT